MVSWSSGSNEARSPVGNRESFPHLTGGRKYPHWTKGLWMDGEGIRKDVKTEWDTRERRKAINDSPLMEKWNYDYYIYMTYTWCIFTSVFSKAWQAHEIIKWDELNRHAEHFKTVIYFIECMYIHPCTHILHTHEISNLKFHGFYCMRWG